MISLASAFLNFEIPNAATWFYLSLILAVALFFKFSRLLSVRNLDVIALFLLVPGLLLREEGYVWFAYLWLIIGSGLWLARCLVDLALVRRPALAPNLNFGGLAWLAGALMACLVAVAYRSPPAEKVGTEAAGLGEGQRRIDALAETAAGRNPPINVRFWVDRTRAILCHLAVVSALIVIGWRHFQDATSGMAAATFYLLLPYTELHVGQWHLVWPSALMLWAIAAYRKPTLAGVLLGLAAGTAYFPMLIFPAWLSFYWGNGGRRFVAAFLVTASLCLAITGLLLSGQLASVIDQTLTLADWQPWRDTTDQVEGLWSGVHWAYRIPIFIAYMAFVVTTFFWPRPKNLAHLIALSAALVIGLQFWFANQGGIYVLWYLPLLLLLVFRPNLSDRLAVPVPPEGDWLARAMLWLVGYVRKPVGIPEPKVPQPQ
jgi:hypothetical protein